MDTLTLDQIATKIATAELGLTTATGIYERNMLTQIRDEYRRYATERAKQEAKLAAAAAEVAELAAAR
ncbi:MAG TPA: hypothetical protein VK836_07285 [Streptosporangiaceae bacterium]|jgi:hypothetical protein|nr:hypothetical protein [Streptosporangiaceae bacterium]